MKKYIILIITLFWVTATLAASELYYYGGGKRINLYMSEENLAVIWNENLQPDDIESKLGGIPIWERQDFSYNRHKFSVLKIDTTGWRRSKQTSADLRALNGIKFAYPLLYTEKNDTLIFTNELVVKLKPPLAPEYLEVMYNVNVIEIDPYDKQCAVLEVQDNSELNALEIANKLVEENNNVKWASPNFICKIMFFGTPGDIYYSNQWALQHIELPAAWDIVTGSSDVTVAVIDKGVDLPHPDLQDVIVTGYDAVDEDNTPQCTPGDAHGTCCAGIVGGITNNGEGISGVAGGWGSSGGCRIMPIRISPYTTYTKIKYCFEWATDHGADIFSCSWGTGFTQIDAIHEGIQYAVNNGALVFFASGNKKMDQGVYYPAKDPLCIAVGATDQQDERWWYSHYGPELDITAPSGDILHDGLCLGDIWTTDNTGEDGYWPLYEEYGSNGSDDGDYFGSFGGTSAACPYAAGVAALIRSLHPSLSSTQVRNAIEMGAEDLGNPGWDSYFGWGRINAYRSIILTLETDLVLQNITVENGETKTYWATNSIQAAGEDINDEQEDTYFIIEDGGNCTMTAGNHISLLPGFEAQEGCDFFASINSSLKTSFSTILAGSSSSDTPEKDALQVSAETEKKEISELIPKVFSCAQNSPNPFNMNTTIRYGLPKSSKVSLCIYNLAGQRIRTLVDANESAGYKTVSWDGRTSSGKEVPQGIYFYKLQAGGDFEKTYKMIVVR